MGVTDIPLRKGPTVTTESFTDTSGSPAPDYRTPPRPPFPFVSTLVAIAGAVILIAGIAGWGTCRQELASQHITVSENGRFYPGQPVDGPFSAIAEAEAINHRMLEATDDKPFAQVSQDDPSKRMATESTVLRTYLLSMMMGFAMSVVAILVGATLITVGVASATRRPPKSFEATT